MRDGLTKRRFLQTTLAAILGSRMAMGKEAEPPLVMTVMGTLPASQLGATLTHEHILVDFTDADKYYQEKWVDDEVIQAVLPHLKEVEKLGCRTFVDCTPNFLGRDVVLLQKLSHQSGLHIITNTGYYGGSNPRHLPAHAFTETAEQLAARWIAEWRDGIDGTGIRPGFLKISVNRESLNEISQKLVRAAALTHLQTGLPIASHTGPAQPAFECLDTLDRQGVAASAFIWVHASGEPSMKLLIDAAGRGAWVSLDGLDDKNVPAYVEKISQLQKANCLGRVLVSHDAGWYKPGEPGGGSIRGYTTLFSRLVPALRDVGFGSEAITQLLERNPGEAFSIGQRRSTAS